MRLVLVSIREDEVSSVLRFRLVDDRCVIDASSAMKLSCINGASGVGINIRIPVCDVTI